MRHNPWPIPRRSEGRSAAGAPPHEEERRPGAPCDVTQKRPHPSPTGLVDAVMHSMHRPKSAFVRFGERQIPWIDAEDALLDGSITHRSSIAEVHPSDSLLFGLNVISERPR
jgi:hypothetical protein